MRNWEVVSSQTSLGVYQEMCAWAAIAACLREAQSERGMIQALHDEALSHNDTKMAQVCELALDNDEDACLQCLHIIVNASQLQAIDRGPVEDNGERLFTDMFVDSGIE